MRKVKIFIILSLFFAASSFATGYFGVRYAANQIFPQVRAGMSDTDWVGVEWIGRSILILFLSLGCLLVSLLFWMRHKHA
jgi:hypothetical protein